MPKAPIEVPCACNDNVKVVAVARKVLQALKGHQLEELIQLSNTPAVERLRAHDLESLADFYQTPTGRALARWNGLLSEDVLYECCKDCIYADVLFAKDTGNAEEEDNFFCVRMAQEDGEWRYFDTFAKTASSIRRCGVTMRISVHEAKQSFRMSMSAPPRSWKTAQDQDGMHGGLGPTVPPFVSPYMNRKRSARPTNLPKIEIPTSPLATRNEGNSGMGGVGGVGVGSGGGYLVPPGGDIARSSVSSEGCSSEVGSDYASEEDLWGVARMNSQQQGGFAVGQVLQSMEGLWALAAMLGVSPAQFVDCAASACNMPILTHHLSEPTSRSVISPTKTPKQQASEFFGPGSSRLLGAR